MKWRIIFTLLVLGICRLASLAPTPGLNSSLLKAYFEHGGGKNGASGLLDMYSVFTGGGFERRAVGIMPYISAAVILYLFFSVAIRAKIEEFGGAGRLIANKPAAPPADKAPEKSA